MPSGRTRLACLALALIWPQGPTLAQGIRILVQSSPLAGSQYYAADSLWPAMAAGDPVSLHREPQNRHDPKAVRVEWHGAKLGYLPRAENGSVAAALDRGEQLRANISRITRHKNPWRRVEIQVWIAL